MIHNLEVGQFVAYHVVMQIRLEEESLIGSTYFLIEDQDMKEELKVEL